MLSALDPFSAFFDRDQFELLQQQTRGEALGFGSILYVQPGKVIVLKAAEGSPSWRAGLGPGDEIVSLNGTRVDLLDFQSLIQLLQRLRSQTVTLGVVPSGKLVSRDVRLQPAEVILPSVDRSFPYGPGLGYIHLSAFEQKTPQEVAAALKHLGGARLKGLVLDLRDNHGGVLEAALGVASLFLKPDLLLLTVRGRAFPEKSYRTTAALVRFDGPLIVLVNENTASAAEVVAAALEEYDRAVIAGEPTFGKGVVESVQSLGERTGLALTMAQYFTPSGRSIQRPLPGSALEQVEPQADTKSRGSAFHTQNGRRVTAGGGVMPDVEIAPWPIDPWAAFLNQRGIFTTFATVYMSEHGRPKESFEPDLQILEQFKEFLLRSAIRVPEEYWTVDQAYLRLRIKTEAFNLAFGLNRGDEVEVRGDPQVQQAMTLFTRVAALLKTPASPPGTIRAQRLVKHR